MKFVYVISPSREGPSKIGVARNLQERLSGLQVAYWDEFNICWFGAFYLPHPNKATLGIGQIFATAEKCAVKLEQAAHRKLKKMGFHIRGEWFDIGPEDAASVVDKIAEKATFKYIEPEDLRKYLRLYGPRGDGNRATMKEVENFSQSMKFGEEAVKRFSKLHPKVEIAC